MPSNLVSFFLVLGIVGGVEFLDRTFYALLALSARYKPFPLWVGATLAYGLTVLIAVLAGAALGGALATYRPYVLLAAGIFLLGYAGYLWFKPEKERVAPAARSLLATGFLVIFLLELGDTTMILSLTFALTLPAVIVGTAALLGLAGASAAACLIGSRVGARVEPRYLEKVVAVILVIVGSVIIVTAFYPSLFPSFG